MKKLLLFLVLIPALILALGVGLIYAGLMPAGFYDLADSYAPPAVLDVLQKIGDAGQSGGEETSLSDDGAASSSEPGLRQAEPAYIMQRVVEGIHAQNEEIKIPLLLPDGDDEAVTAFFLNAVERSIDTIRREMPEIFWVSLGTFGVEWSGNRDSKEALLTVRLKYSYSPGKVADLREEMRRIIDVLMYSAPPEPVDAVTYFHDWIALHTEYATYIAEADGAFRQDYGYGLNINGVFLRGSAICEGYSKAFKLLCDRAGIPCEIIFGVADGENHSWNYVRLDGIWYLVDCTWNSPVSDEKIIRHDYFLKGSQSIVEGKTIAEIYTNDGAGYPPLSPAGYFEQDFLRPLAALRVVPQFPSRFCRWL